MSSRRRRQASSLNRRSFHRQASGSARRSLRFEPLEDRRLLAVTTNLNGDILEIDMDAAGDTATVSVSGANIQVNGANAATVAGVTRIEASGDADPNQSLVLASPLSLTNGLTVNGTVEVTDVNAELSGATVGQSISINSQSINLNANISTDGGDVNLTAPIELLSDVVIDTDEVGGGSDAGSVVIEAVDGAHMLTIDATADGGANDGDVTFENVGSTTPLESFQALTGSAAIWDGTELRTDGGNVHLQANILQTTTTLPNSLIIDTESGADEDAGDVNLDVGMVFDASALGIASIKINTGTGAAFAAGDVLLPPGFSQVGLSGSSVNFQDFFGNMISVNQTAFQAAFADYGDAPDTYGTLLASDGARHLTTAGSLVQLGGSRDSEADGLPNAAADGDDTTAVADEDGVTFLTLLAPNQTAQISVSMATAALLDGWIDFDADGTFDASEHINGGASLFLSGGTHTINIPVPAAAVVGDTYARFRVSTSGGLSPTGVAADGEVEDYLVTISPGAGPEINLQTGGSSVLNGDTAPSAGSTNVGTSVTQTFTIQNIGTATLNLTGTPLVDVGGANAGDFTVTTAPGTPIGAGMTTDFVVTFMPSAPGVRTATLTIANDDTTDGEDPYVITIEGTGVAVAPEINVNDGTVDIASGATAPSFGNVSVGATETLSYLLQNTGTAPLTLTGTPIIAVSGANAAEFVVTQPASNTVNAMGQTTFNVMFTPTAPGTRTATLTIANDDGDEDPYVINLTGTAVAPEINVQVGGVSVPDGGTAANLGTTSGTINATVTIQNTGTETLNLTGMPIVTVTGTNPADFVVTQPASNTIAASGSVSFNVAFTPTNNGLRSAVLSISNNDSDENPYTITLEGDGTGFSTSIPFNEDFNDGMADPVLTTQSGTFTVIGMEFSGTHTPGSNAINTFNLGTLPTQGVTVNTTVRTGPTGANTFSNGFIVFDYANPTNFKVAGIEAKNNRLVIARVVNGVYTRIASTSSNFATGVNHTLSAQISSTGVTVTANGTTVTSATVANPLDGLIGIGTINANTVFDNISVTTP